METQVSSLLELQVGSCATNSVEGRIPSAAVVDDMALTEGRPSNMGTSTQGGAQSPDVHEAVAAQSSGPFQAQTETAKPDPAGKCREAAEVDVDVERVPDDRCSTPAAPKSLAGGASVEAVGVTEVVQMDLPTYVAETSNERDFPEAIPAIEGQAGGAYSTEKVNDNRTEEGIAVEVVLEGAATSGYEDPSGMGMVMEAGKVLDDGVDQVNMEIIDGRIRERGDSVIGAASTAEKLGVWMDSQKEVTDSLIENPLELPVATEEDASVVSGMAEVVRPSLHQNALDDIAEKLTSDTMDVLTEEENNATVTERENVAEEAAVDDGDEGLTIPPVVAKESPSVSFSSTIKMEEGPVIERTFEAILIQPSAGTKADVLDVGAERGDVLASTEVLECSTADESTIEASLLPPEAVDMMESVKDSCESGDKLIAATISLPPAAMMTAGSESSSAAELQLNSPLVSVPSKDAQAITVEESAIAEQQPNLPLTAFTSEGPATITQRRDNLKDGMVSVGEVVIRRSLDEGTAPARSPTPAMAAGCAEIVPPAEGPPMSTAVADARSSDLGIGPLDSGNRYAEEGESTKAREEIPMAAITSSNPVEGLETETTNTEGRRSEATILIEERINVDDKSAPQRLETGEAKELAGGNENGGKISQNAIDGFSAELGTTTETRTETPVKRDILSTGTVMLQIPRGKEETMEMPEEKNEVEMEEATVGGEQAKFDVPVAAAAADEDVIANFEIVVGGEKDVEMGDPYEEAAAGTGVPATVTVSEDLMIEEKVAWAGNITVNTEIALEGKAVEDNTERQELVVTKETINNSEDEESIRMRMAERREEENVEKTGNLVEKKLDEAATELVTSGGQFSTEEVSAIATFANEANPVEDPMVTEEKEAVELLKHQRGTEGREENLGMEDLSKEGAAAGEFEHGSSAGEDLPTEEAGRESNAEEHILAIEEAIETAKNADPEVKIGVERGEDAVVVTISEVVGEAAGDIMAAVESATAALEKDGVEMHESLNQLVEAEMTSVQEGGDIMKGEHISDDGMDPVVESQAIHTTTTTVTVTREQLDDDDDENETGGEDVDGSHGLLMGVGSSVENGGLKIMEVTSTTVVVENAPHDLADNSQSQRGLSEPLITPPPEEILEALEAVHHPLEEEADLHLLTTRGGDDDESDDVVVVDKASEGTEKGGDATTVVVVTTEEGEKVQNELEGVPGRGEVSESEGVMRDLTLPSLGDIARQDPLPVIKIEAKKDFSAAAVELDSAETDTVEEAVVGLSTAAATEAGIAAARKLKDDEQQLQQTATGALEENSTTDDGMKSSVDEFAAQANEYHLHAPNEVVDRASLDVASVPTVHKSLMEEDLVRVDNSKKLEETPDAVALSGSGLTAGHAVSMDASATKNYRHGEYVPRSDANADLEDEGGKMNSATDERNTAAADLDKNEKKRGREEDDVETALEDKEKTLKAAKTLTVENSLSEAKAAAGDDALAAVVARNDVRPSEDVTDDKKRSRADLEGEAAGETDSLLQSKIQKTGITSGNEAGVQSCTVDAGGMETEVTDEEDVGEKTLDTTIRQDSGAPRYKKRKIALFLGYSGAGYQGMQKNPGAITIEGELEEALFRAGAIAESNYGDPRKVDWRRAARTDKGVSALGQVVSGCFFIDPPGFIERVNSHLPKQIRVFGYKRATATFNAKKLCDRRRYQYVLPVYVFDPSVHLDRQTARDRRQAAEAPAVPESIVLVENTSQIKSITATISDPAGEGEAAAAVLDLMEEAAPVPVEEEKGTNMIPFDSSPEVGVNAAAAAVEAAAGASLLEQATTNPVSTNVVEEVLVLEKSDVQDGGSGGSKEVVLEQTKEVVNITKAEVVELLSPAEMKQALDEKVKKSTFNFGEAESNRLNRILKKFEGHHNFHNFTARTKSSDPSANRYILSFEADDKTFMVDGMEFVKCTVVGQSFMLHQIRKMIGLTVAIMRGLAPESILDAALQRDTDINVPMAPEVGLFLEECYYSAYNRRFQRTHEELSLSALETEIGEFKQEYIYPHIVSMETRESTFAMWLHTLNDRNFPEFIVARAKGNLLVG